MTMPVSVENTMRTLEPFLANALFRGVERVHATAALNGSDHQLFASGELIFDQDDPAAGRPNAGVYLIGSGRVRITCTLGAGRDEELAILAPGEFFGEVALLAGDTRSARATAMDTADVALIGLDQTDALLAADGRAVLRNITQALAARLRNTDEALVRTRLTQEKLAAIGTLVQQIAHDLKSPLNAVAGVAALLEIDAPTPPSAEKARILDRAVRYINGLTEDIMIFARGRPQRTATETSLTPILAAIDDLGLQPLTQKKRIAVTREFNASTRVKVDPVAIERVLLNLVKNAVEAMPTGGTLSVSTRDSEGCVEIRIADTGTGIAPELNDRLFQPFATAGKEGGTGLGLAMAKQTVEAFGGSIVVESSSGRGTTFTIRLPAVN